jgi:hypothetical protein
MYRTSSPSPIPREPRNWWWGHGFVLIFYVVLAVGVGGACHGIWREAVNHHETIQRHIAAHECCVRFDNVECAEWHRPNGTFLCQGYIPNE